MHNSQRCLWTLLKHHTHIASKIQHGIRFSPFSINFLHDVEIKHSSSIRSAVYSVSNQSYSFDLNIRKNGTTNTGKMFSFSEKIAVILIFSSFLHADIIRAGNSQETGKRFASKKNFTINLYVACQSCTVSKQIHVTLARAYVHLSANTPAAKHTNSTISLFSDFIFKLLEYSRASVFYGILFNRYLRRCNN